MSESKKNIEIHNGWILCPSKSFPGKFYYFNVINGEAAWSLNQSDNKGFIKERNFHKITDQSHGYPEPSTLPYNIFINTKKRDFLRNIPNIQQLPRFGQTSFPKYVTKVEPLIPNKFSPETENPMIDQLSEFEHLTISQFTKQANIPLRKRSTNYNKPCFSLDRNYKNVKPLAKFETSTPKNLFLECFSESQNFFQKTLIRDPTLKLEPKSPTSKIPDVVKRNEKTTISFSRKVESPKSSAPKFVKKEEVLENLDSSDLRFLLLAKRKTTDAADTAVERKKPKTIEVKPQTLKKRVTFNLKAKTDDETTNAETQDFIPLKQNLTRTIIEAPKSPVLLKDKTPPSFIKESPKTPSPNIEDQPSTLQPIAKYQPPTLQPIANYQPPTFQPIANYQPPTCQPTANYQPPILQSIANYQPPTLQPIANYQPPTLQPTANYQRPTFNNSTWYIVVDTDVLLLDYEFIDKVALSDPKCRLIIPHAVAADIQALCMGDCHGQQLVITARHLTRKLATPPPHYIVEPRTSESGNIVVTTDSILQCCMKVVHKNYYVVLITNDPHLQVRATLLNIQSYKLNEIKYGVHIKPKITPEQKNYNIFTPNNDVTDTKNQFNQRLISNMDIKPEITSDEAITSRNDIDGKNQNNNNFSMSPVKMQLFLSTDSETDSSLDSDKLNNVTPQKCIKYIENIKFDNNGLSDISSEVSTLNLKDKNVLKPQNVDKPQPQNVKENGFVNVKKRILDPNTYSLRTTNPKKKPVSKPNHDDIYDFQKDNLDYNFENSDNSFCSTPITNMKRFEPKSELEESVKPVMPATCLSLRQEPFGVTREKKILNPSQTRIEKIIRNINNDSIMKTQLDNQIPKTKDSTGLFKIPQLKPMKNATRYTSVHVENSTVNDQIGTRTNIDSIDENLSGFHIKSMNMRNKIKTRIDEWICSYMQIMEDALMHILQKNCVCMENIVAPLTLKDTLNCIKMLFGSHIKITDFTNKLSELLEKSMLCVPGHLKMSIIPDEFMKIFGYGVLLVQALKIVHPQNEELNEAELRLKHLQTNLEGKTKEFDPELVKSPLNKSEVDNGLEEVRPQFLKKKSAVIDYLKKHFKEWKTYNEDFDYQNHMIEDHTDFKVVRTLGKNLNLLKIDNNKMMSLTNVTVEEDLANKSENGPKLIGLFENNQINKFDNIENVEINSKPLRKNLNLVKEDSKKIVSLNNKTMEEDLAHNSKNGPKLIRLLVNNQINKPDNIENIEENTKNETKLNKTEIATDQEKDVPLKKMIENKENNESKVNEEFNYTTHENTFLENTEKNGPKVIRNIKLIDEFENKHSEPLDLDLFYSELYEPSIDENIIDFDVLSEKKKNSQKDRNNHFEDNNYGLDNRILTLEDFYITPSISSGSKNNNYTFDTEHSSKKVIENSENTRCFNSVSENNDKNTQDEENTKKNDCGDESETYTENQESQNGSCIVNGNFETIGNSKTPNNNSGTHVDNFGKPAQIVRDDSTNDSGFENDSTYAHTMVKICLNELSTTFKVIHTFVTKFIDEIRETELSEKRKNSVHTQASKALEDMVAIIQHLRSIIKRESAESTVLKILLRNAGVEATTDKRMTRYRQIVIKCVEQALILESALKVIVSTTMGDFEALSTNAETLNSSIRYFNIFE